MKTKQKMKSVNRARDDLQKIIDTAKEHSAKKLPTAFYQWRRAADRSADLLGQYHASTVFCVNNVGKTLVEIGCHKEAISLLEASLRQSITVHGCAHFAVEHACQSLGRAYTAMGRHALAGQWWKAAAISSESLRGKEHQTTVFCLSQQAQALTRLGLNAEALPIFHEVLSRTKNVFGRHVHTAYAARRTAECLNQLGYFEEALPVWKLAVKCFTQEQTLSPKHLKSLNMTYSELHLTKDKVKQLRATGAAETGVVGVKAA